MIKKFNEKKMRYGRIIDKFLKIFYFKNVIFKKPKNDFNINNKEAKSILLFEFGLMGDIIMLIPALKAIKDSRPDIKVTLVSGSFGKLLLSEQGLVDEFITFNCPWRTKNYSIKNFVNMFKTLKVIRKNRYDAGIDFKGDIRNILYLYYSKCKARISYSFTGGEYLLTDIIEPDDKVEHLIDNNMYLLDKIGFKYESSIPELKWNINHDEIKEENKIIFGIHPGSSMEKKIWQVDKFVQIIRLAVQDGKYKILVFEGPGESDIVKNILNLLDDTEKTKITVIKTGLKDYISYLNSCDIVLCNDSGAGHISSSLGKAVVVIFGPTEPELGAPYGRKVTSISKKMPCKPCSGDKCPTSKECFQQVTVDEVYSAIQSAID